MNFQLSTFNFKKILKTRKVFVVALALTVVSLGLVLTLSKDKRDALAATYTWVQSSWAGGATANTGVHPTDQNTWTQYSAKDANVTAGGTGVSLATTPSTDVDTTYDDFTTTGFATTSAVRIKDSAQPTSASAGLVTIASTSVSWLQTTDSDFNTTGAATSSTKVIGGSVMFTGQISGGESGLTGLWHFNGSGNIANGASIPDSQTNYAARNGTAQNPNGTGMAYTTGQLGTGINFDGTDYVSNSTALSNFLSVSQGTVEAWVKPTGSNPSCSSYSYNCSGIVTDNAGYLAMTRGTLCGASSICYHFYGTGDNYGTTAYTVDTWHHFAWVKNGSTLYGYKNGSLVATIGTSNSAMGTLLKIGQNYQSSFFTGVIDEVAVYNRPLSTAEILAHYNDALGGIPTSGIYTSAVHDTGGNSTIDYTTVSWTSTIPSGTQIVLDAQSCNDSACSGDAWNNAVATITTSNPNSSATLPITDGNRWVRYRANLTGDGTATPSLDSLTLNAFYW